MNEHHKSDIIHFLLRFSVHSRALCGTVFFIPPNPNAALYFAAYSAITDLHINEVAMVNLCSVLERLDTVEPQMGRGRPTINIPFESIESEDDQPSTSRWSPLKAIY